ncbi:MAG: acyl-CoA desaturase [Deltaproteobacteria bacterium]|nr:acyl-CoA desaturase [Deltaproteobacteria bacterium]
MRWQQLKARLSPDEDHRIDWFLSAPFWAIHLSLIALYWLGLGRRELIFFGVFYAVGMFLITAGYHRYFSHRAFRTGRAMQFLLALGAQLTIQRGVLWWAGHHRHHHKHADDDRDVHTPRRGFFWSHIGWFLCNRHETARLELVRDFARFPELRWLERWYWVPPLVFGSVVATVGGAKLLIGGYFLAVVVLYHVTFTINSLAHLWGQRRFATRDDSRNNALLALLTFGEGWHNNHHHAPSSARQGFRWWEIDISYYALRLLSALGLVWELKPVPAYARVTPTSSARPPVARLARPLLALALLLLPAESAAAERFTFSGVARTKDGRVAYREIHREHRAKGRLTRVLTRYYSAEGNLIAQLESDFRKNTHAPDYRFTDYRRPAFSEGAAVVGDRLVLTARGHSELIALPRSAPLVLGQGLHHFVRNNFDALERGQTLRVNFAIPSRFDTYRFRVRKLSDPQPGVVRLRVEIDSWVLRLLAPHLEVDYLRDGRRLLSYRGVSNIQTVDGDQQSVTIGYRYGRTPQGE